MNLVDSDSKELVSAWILSSTAVAPAVLRTYDVDLAVGKPTTKKIIFKNPWDAPRRFAVRICTDHVILESTQIKLPPFSLPLPSADGLLAVILEQRSNYETKVS